MTEPTQSFSGCTVYDDIQTRLQDAKTALTTAVTEVEQAAARAALTLIETEAAGGGEWTNTSGQITQIQMVTATSNMNAGSGFAVYGQNF
jgi:hypothetical protein